MNNDILLDEIEKLEDEIDTLRQIDDQHRTMNGRIREELDKERMNLLEQQYLVNELTKLIFETKDEKLIERAKKLRGVEKTECLF